MKRSVGIMHLIDTLEAGGAERVAVNLVNHLPRSTYRPYLCTTRREGPLAKLIAPHVGRVRLERSHRFDWRGLQRLVAFVRRHDVQILHAHGTSLFVAVAASLLPPFPRVVWHDHNGRTIPRRRAWLYRPVVARASRVISVNRSLGDWAHRHLSLPKSRVTYIPNFVTEPQTRPTPAPLPGHSGTRIVCVANIRPQKDHFALIRAMLTVINQVPVAHLLLVGSASDASYLAALKAESRRLHLEQAVSFLGSRDDVPAILSACDIAVLSSASEGFPLALLEYGMAGLPVVATRVGACAELLDEGAAGLLVPPGDPNPLAKCLIELLSSPARRRSLGTSLKQRVHTNYSPEKNLDQVCQVYEAVMADGPLDEARSTGA